MRRYRCRHAAKRAPAGPPRKNPRTKDKPPPYGVLPIGAGVPIYRVRSDGGLVQTMGPMTTIDEIVENFALLDEWDDRYRYVIELGRSLPPLPEADHSEANKVRGCASQVWLVTHVKPDGAAGPILTFEGDSDAHIVRGLIAILFALYAGKSARQILDIDAIAVFDRLGLRENLTPQRSNGLRSMVERIRADADAALAAVA